MNQFQKCLYTYREHQKEKHANVWGAGSTSHTFSDHNSIMDIYYLNLFKSQKVSNGSLTNSNVFPYQKVNNSF